MSDQDDEHRPRQPAAPLRRVAIDPQTGQISSCSRARPLEWMDTDDEESD